MRSIWDGSTAMPEFKQLNGNIKTDVLVIGGGIAGLLTAYFLKEKGVECTVTEKDVICGGVTYGTTAKITAQHGLIYSRIAADMGIEKAQMYLEANLQALKKYAEMCESIGCDFERKDSYVYSRNNSAALESEMDTLRKIGYKDAVLRGDIPLPIKTAGAVMFKGQAQFNPFRFLAHIAKELTIYEHTPVVEMVGNTAVTPSGKIKAQKVIVCTHFPFINKHGLYFLKMYQHRSYTVALTGAPDVNGMYVDESGNGLSFRNYKKYLLLGGGGHRTGKNGGGYTTLSAAAKRIFPGAEERYRFAAQDCMSLDGVPYIGKYSNSTPDLYVCTGFNKWGMTSAMVSAMLISDMMTGKENQYAPLFDPSRGILKPQLAVNGFEAVTSLLTPAKKRCPHMGCALKYNKAEHSWDCPCHGSRFTENGRVLNNPANGDMKK